jgi:hypothetical protein
MILFVSLLVFDTVTFVYNIIDWCDPLNDEKYDVYWYLDSISTGITLFIDVIMSFVFIRILVFYIKNKQH